MADGNLTGIRRRDRRRTTVVVRSASTPDYIGDPADETPSAGGVSSLDHEEDYGGGAQSLTATLATLFPSGTGPEIILGAAGTYLLMGSMQFEANGATVTTETIAFELSRTNNSPAAIANSTVSVDLPVMTTLTHTLGVFHMPAVVYTTAADDDEIVIQGLISAALAAGTIDASGGSIVAVKIG